MSKKNLVQITTDEKGREIVMVRVDKTLKGMMEEKPTSRWSPGYWHPSFDYLNDLLTTTDAKSILEIESEKAVIAGDHVRPSRGEKKGFDLKTGIEYYETAGFLETGYDYSEIKECSSNTYERLKETAVKKYDILISVAGVGGVGKAKSCIVLNEPAKKSCTGDVFSIRLKKINSIYFYILLKSKIGKGQILKMKNGVSTENLNTKEALAIRVPKIADKVEKNIVYEFNKIISFHNKAMEAKKKGNDIDHKKNIEIAEKMLKNLITKTEAVIRGEQKDVI